jgi:hypothetical protein
MKCNNDSRSRKVMAAMLVLIASLMVSNALYHILRADILVWQLSSSAEGIALFVALIVIPYGAAMYLFRKLIYPANKDLTAAGSQSALYFRLSYKILTFALVSNAVFLAIISIQIVTVSEFYVGLTVLSMQANAVLATVMFTYLSYKFFSWYRSNHDLTVLFFGLAFASIAIAVATSDGAQIAAFFLLDNPGRTEEALVSLPGDDAPTTPGYSQPENVKSDPILHDLYLATQFPLRIAFVLYWLATATLLRKYSKTIGKLRFWTLVSLPLATFAVGSVFTYGDLVPQLWQGIILPSSALLGGILFGVIFWTIAKALEATGNQRLPSIQDGERKTRNGRSTAISRYLTMAVFGTILFLVTNTPSNHIIDWVRIPYLPFADVVWSFTGFAAYLYSSGLFFSIISISQDTGLRKSIHKLATEEANMLNSLGFVQMQQEIQKRVVKLSEEQAEVLKEQTGVEQQQIDDAEIKRYIEEVMHEIRKDQRKPQS